LWFLLEVDLNAVLCTTWCPSLRGTAKKDELGNFIGILAVGGMKGPISLYGIQCDMPVPLTDNNEPRVYRTQPHIVLPSPDCCHILLWDLDDDTICARTIFSADWLSPPLSVAYCGEERLAVSFREKMIRIYDIKTLRCIIEEGAQRTAGMQVYSRQRLFNGIFSYQQDYTLNGIHLTCGVCYVTSGSTKENVFVLPLANKHEVQVWDMCVCPRTGAVVSVGGDGRLIISQNGRLAPHESDNDLSFNACRVVMTLLRKSDEKLPQAKQPGSSFTYRLVAKKLHIYGPLVAINLKASSTFLK
uniref:WD repeat-containing protein 45 n=1 Tax=Gongylonema pulchrum TaxID=637853 RepID=A0A183EQ15_9BILA